MTPAQLKRLAKLEAAAPTGAGNWVRSLSGAIIWDPWDPDDITDEEARATMARLVDQMERTAERLRADPDWREPTEEQLERGRRAFEDALADQRAKWDAVRAFTAQVERERAERMA